MVETFFNMFSGTTVFNRDLQMWNVTSATNLVGMVRPLFVFNAEANYHIPFLYSFLERSVLTKTSVDGDSRYHHQPIQKECSQALHALFRSTPSMKILFGRDPSVGFVTADFRVSFPFLPPYYIIADFWRSLVVFV